MRPQSGEFQFIDNIKTLFNDIKKENTIGIGDDCAVIDLGDDVIVSTTDMLIEDIHFIRNATSAKDLGKKSLLVNLSDVVAMGINPQYSMLSIAIPKECQGSWVNEFMDGYHTISKQHNVMLIGGDTTASKDKIAINVTAIGRGKKSSLKQRCNAKIGDIILVSGSLGESAAGLIDILNGDINTPNAKIHKLPSVNINEGIWLGTRPEVHAMMDISDGIASDLNHILKSSNLSAKIDLNKIPTSTSIENAICGGEDYKLLLTAEPQEIKNLMNDFNSQFNGNPLYIIGEITPNIPPQNNTITWLSNGSKINPEWSGFSHF